MLQVRCAIDFPSFGDILQFLRELKKRSAGECFCDFFESHLSDIRRVFNHNLTLRLYPVVPFGSDKEFDSDKFQDCILRVLRVKNRFHPAIDETKLLGGYRDIGLKLQIGFVMASDGDAQFVPCKLWKDTNSNLKVAGVLSTVEIILIFFLM